MKGKNPSVSDIQKRAAEIKRQRLIEEALVMENYNKSKGRQFDKWIRIIFLIQFFFSMIGLFYFPFSTQHTVANYSLNTYRECGSPERRHRVY